MRTPTEDFIYRHENFTIVQSNLDHTEDLLNLLSSLRSSGFVKELLVKYHGFSNKHEIDAVSKLVKFHIDNSIELAIQGLHSSPHTSFLSLYYSCLNLVKVYLLLLGQRKELARNRKHGLAYIESDMSKDFLNEQVKILTKGTFPLIYQTLFHKTFAKSPYLVSIEEIYSNIHCINAEYITLCKDSVGFEEVRVAIKGSEKKGFYINVDSFWEEFIRKDLTPRLIPTFNEIQNNINPTFFSTKVYKGNRDKVVNKIQEHNLNRNLLSDVILSWEKNKNSSIIPINGRNHVFNEDLYIFLAFFHLSNVIRYNPEHLHKLMDSRYWTVILALRRHGFFRFLTLMWGNFIKSSFGIVCHLKEYEKK